MNVSYIGMTTMTLRERFSNHRYQGSIHKHFVEIHGTVKPRNARTFRSRKSARLTVGQIRSYDGHFLSKEFFFKVQPIQMYEICNIRLSNALIDIISTKV